jgi:hypothetical protein
MKMKTLRRVGRIQRTRWMHPPLREEKEVLQLKECPH